jgi:hypothetical protein
MDTIKRYFLVFVSIVMLVPVMNSCRKGDEDPLISLYSRKHRLCQDWNFSYYKRTEQHNNVTVYYEFDGASLTKVEGSHVSISHATMQLSFRKDGTYLWAETITTDTSLYNYNEEGSWYFTGGSKESDTKNKELLALQKTKVTTILQSDGTTTSETYNGSGNLDAAVFKIIKLSSKEVKLELKLETDHIQISPNTTDLQILTINVTLTKS